MNSEGARRNEGAGAPDTQVARTTSADIGTAVARAVVGAAPFVGAALAEIATAIIPGQRMDRLQRFVECLAVHLDAFEKHVIEEKMKTPEAVDLLEDCYYGAARALSQERIDHLANLYVTGITSEQADHETNKKLITLLNQLTDAEVIWLSHLAQFQHIGTEIDKHEEVLTPRTAWMGGSVEDFDAEAVQEAWKDRLIQLGLAHAKISRGTGDLGFEMDRHSGEWRRDSPEATWLGRMLLNVIGIGEPLRHPMTVKSQAETGEATPS